MDEMTDKELLERAAKAFWSRELADDEVSIRYSEDDEGILYLHADNQDHNGRDREFRWNPLLEDADALQLAVKLHISIRHPSPLDLGGGYVTASICAYRHRYKFPKKTDFSVILGSEECPNDLLIATRRAVVRAAASLAAEGGV